MTTREPMTGAELDDIEGRWSRYVALRDPDSMETSVHDVPGLLAEIDRLRAVEKSAVLRQIVEERARQVEKWGEQNHPDGTGDYPEILDADVAKMACQGAAEGGYLDWLHILREEVAEAFAESDPSKLRTELVQVAAVAVAWVEAIDRREATR